MKKMLIVFWVAMLVLTLLSCGEEVYEVNFIVDGEICQIIEVSGNEAILLPQEPIKEDQVFDGWYYDEGVWKKPFTIDTLVDTQPSETVNVYGKWTEKVEETKTASVDIASSLLMVSEKTATATVSNATITFSFFDDIKVAGGASYILATDIGCQNAVMSKTVALSEGDNTYYLLVTNEDNQKLYTVTIHRRSIYTVDFNTHGGTLFESIRLEEGNSLENMEDAHKIGYVFNGWTSNGEAVTFPYNVASNTTLNAEYTIVTYDITYHLNGGENGKKNVANYTIEQELTLENPTREGYAFLGWFTDAAFENKVEKIDLGSNGNKEFYAKWQACENKLTFDGNGAIDGSMADVMIYTDETLTLSSNKFVRNGYTFKGWATSPDGKVVYADGASYTAEKNGAYTLYAIWKANYNFLMFNSNGGLGNMAIMTFATDSNKALPLNSFTKYGYTFRGWSTSLDGEVEYTDGASYTMGTDSTYTLFAVWEAIYNNLTFESNGGSGNMSDMKIAVASSINLTRNCFIKPGYTFNGWSTTPDGEVEYQDCDTYVMGTDSAYVLYAVWEINDNTLSFDSNGGDGNMPTMTITTNSSKRLLSNSFSKPGYTFVGWSTTSEGEVEYANGDSYTMGTDSSYTLYAVWEANKNVLIFNSNGGYGNMADMIIATGSSVALTNNSFSGLGGTFIGWSTTPDGEVEYADGATYTMGTNGTYILYAVWRYKSNVIPL